MRQRRAAWILGLVVLGLVGFIGWKWSARRSVERTVSVFLTAMIQGNSEILVEQLDGPALESYLKKSPEEQKAFAAPIPGAKSEIREVHLKGSSAKVRVLWMVSGFDIWSDLELAKSSTGLWKITNIKQPSMIPSWEQVRKRLEKGSPLSSKAEALGEKLDGREGVETRPLEDNELDQ